MEFLIANREDFKKSKKEQLDFILITPDAYVDHPSFANALIGRFLESLGFSVGIISQPDYKDTNSVKVYGEPKYAFLVSGGNLDSMVNLYTANKHPRKKDDYSAGGKIKNRPKHPAITYTSLAKSVYPETPVIIGGIECSLRKLAHYDYWEDCVRRSILFDSKADLLIYGMGESPLSEITYALKEGKKIEEITHVRGTCCISQNKPKQEYIQLPSFEDVLKDKKAYNLAVKLAYYENDFYTARTVVQKHENRYLIQNPPQRPLNVREMDTIYNLPFTRLAHPMYKENIPALNEVKFGIIATRGCFSGCSFCAIGAHQGQHIQKRSQKSILNEVKALTEFPDFKGYIHDIGGPTANFYKNPCAKSMAKGFCRDRKCLFPEKCKNCNISHEEYLKILTEARKIKGVKKVFVRSGIRYDAVVYDKSPTFLNELTKHHVSGQLKVAPEHVSAHVLKAMRKPSIEVYNKFSKAFVLANKRFNLKQYIIPYFISAHPGSSITDAISLAVFLKESRFIPEQIQDFYPTPGTLSTAMYYTGFDTITGEKVYVARSESERLEQRILLQFNKKENKQRIREILIREKREDLIGRGSKCLVD